MTTNKSTNNFELIRDLFKSLTVCRNIRKIIDVNGREILIESNNTRILVYLKNDNEKIPSSYSHGAFLHDSGEEIKRDDRLDPLNYTIIKSDPLFFINTGWS